MNPSTLWTAIMCITGLLLFGSNDAHALVTLAGTRLIFDGRFQEATIDVSNPGSDSVLIQAWIEGVKEGRATTQDLPFVLTPHLSQIPAQGKQVLRVLYEGVGVPTDRESLLHLYVLEIPRRSLAAQQLNIAVRQRINVFYRPNGFPGDPAGMTESLRWQFEDVDRGALRVTNPTPFHASLLNIAFNGVEISKDVMLEPFSEQLLRVPEQVAATSGEGVLRFKALTDYGGQREFCAAFFGPAAFTARLLTDGAHAAPIPPSPLSPLIGKC